MQQLRRLVEKQGRSLELTIIQNFDELLIQGQFGELLLFHFIQKFMQATPLLRKMKIATSSF